MRKRYTHVEYNMFQQLDTNPVQITTLFAGEKRSREEPVEGVVVGGWRRKTHEWLYSTVSGTGARRDNRVQQTRGTVPVSLLSLVPMNSAARGSTSGGYMGTGGAKWSNSYNY